MCYKCFILLVENKVYNYMLAATVEYFRVPRPSQHLSSHCSLVTPVLKGFPFYTKDMEEHSSLVQLNSLPQAMEADLYRHTYRVPALTPPQGHCPDPASSSIRRQLERKYQNPPCSREDFRASYPLRSLREVFLLRAQQ